MDTITAQRIQQELVLDACHPAKAWYSAAPVAFCADWRGENADPARETRVRALWSPAMLYLRFECRYRELFVFDDSDASGRRDQLWDRDVAEAFLQPDGMVQGYREFEVSPNGMWIDLDIFPGGRRDLQSRMARSVWLDRERKLWAAEVAIPMDALKTQFDSTREWRVNFYRVEGRSEPRFYSAWRPTNSPQPNFHVPEAFGRMRFV